MSETKDLLSFLGIKPNKDRGQNFLQNPLVVDQIISFAAPSKSENLIEIGPGLGALTAELYAIAPLTVIEIEKSFCKYLAKEFPELKIVNEDVRLVDLEELRADSPEQKKLTIFGNLPYSFSSDITQLLLTFPRDIERVIIMLQKEFSERLAAVPGTKAYGALTVYVQVLADCVLGPIIEGDQFYPSTKVQSQVIELRFYDQPKYDIKDDYVFKSLVKNLFSERRKKIRNTFTRHYGETIKNPEEFLIKHSFNPALRSDQIAVEEYVRLANLVAEETAMIVHHKS